MSPAVETGLAADGDPLADGTEEVFDSIVHPTRGRIVLTISATGPLKPKAGVELAIEGVAQEPIDSGEVVLTLPTKALMDHVGEGRPDLPVKARWVLPRMAAGDTWSGIYTVPGEGAGYYRVMANAYTHGPDGGPYLFDDVVRQAWMFVSETDGQLTRWFEDSLFPEGVHPVAGPATADGATRPMARSPTRTSWHRDSVYLHVVYTVSANDGFKPAVRTKIWGNWSLGPDGHEYRQVTVPEDGIVAFGCRLPSGAHWRGGGEAPDTRLVQGRKDITSWSANESHCGQKVLVEVKAHRYLPWRLLNLSADTVTKHFGHTRSRIKWNLKFDGRGSSYNSSWDKITLAWELADEELFHWVVAHEYGHALHHKALGGMWRAGNCGSDHWFDVVTSYECALQEGFAHHAGSIGADGEWEEDCFEHFGTSDAEPSWCRDAPHDQKPKIEGWVAAFFLDLTDDEEEEGDYTEYPGLYIAQVFKSCEVKHPSWWKKDWKKRSKVPDIVWCLERLVTASVHLAAFPGTPAPDTVREEAREPPDWYWYDIRRTWQKNLTNGLVMRRRE